MAAAGGRRAQCHCQYPPLALAATVNKRRLHATPAFVCCGENMIITIKCGTSI